jgi:hypothetical protein
MYELFVAFFFLFLLVLAKVVLDIKELFTVSQYLNHKSKCYDCEQDIISREGEDAAWKAQPTKSFDSEAQGVQMDGNGFIGKTLKYY